MARGIVSVLLSADLVSIPCKAIRNTLKWYSQFSCVALSAKEKCGEEAGKFACCIHKCRVNRVLVLSQLQFFLIEATYSIA